MYYIDMEFEWDPEKSKSNLKKHGISFEEAKEIFLVPFAKLHDLGIVRYQPARSPHEAWTRIAAPITVLHAR